jgi:hypothetical protein
MSIRRIIYIPFVPVIDTKAIYLQSNIFLKNSADGALLSIGNTWSIQTNFIPRLTTGNAYVVSIQNAVNNQSQIIILENRNQDPENIQVVIRRDTGGGGEIKNFKWNRDSVVDTKISFMVTYDGPTHTLKLYLDGVDQGDADVKATDSSTGFQSDQVRKIALGNFGTSNFGPLFGDMHSTTMWDVALSQAEVTALDNSGAPDVLDNRFATGDYTSVANMMHYWRLGVDALDLGKDDGNASVLVDIDEDSSGDLAGNIVDYE